MSALSAHLPSSHSLLTARNAHSHRRANGSFPPIPDSSFRGSAHRPLLSEVACPVEYALIGRLAKMRSLSFRICTLRQARHVSSSSPWFAPQFSCASALAARTLIGLVQISSPQVSQCTEYQITVPLMLSRSIRKQALRAGAAPKPRVFCGPSFPVSRAGSGCVPHSPLHSASQTSNLAGLSSACDREPGRRGCRLQS
jgi:hypothetical protein